MSKYPNKKDAYLKIVKQMKNDLSGFSLPEEAPDDKTLIDTIHSKWNTLYNKGKHWDTVAKKELQHSALLRKFKYDTKAEILKHGRRILRVARMLKFSNTGAIKKQHRFIEELEDRLDFITAHY